MFILLAKQQYEFNEKKAQDKEDIYLGKPSKTGDDIMRHFSSQGGSCVWRSAQPQVHKGNEIFALLK